MRSLLRDNCDALQIKIYSGLLVQRCLPGHATARQMNYLQQHPARRCHGADKSENKDQLLYSLSFCGATRKVVAIHVPPKSAVFGQPGV